MRLLFVSYNGTSDPLVHTQGIAYLKDLKRRGVTVHLVTFEHPQGFRQADRTERNRLRKEFATWGMVWHPLRYHKRPAVLSTVFDVTCGWLYTWYLVRRHHITLLHARGSIPAAMVAPVARATGVRWLFDLRGLLAEEYVDGGLWRRGGLLHRVVSAVERALIRHADALVVLTERAAQILTQDPRWRLPRHLNLQVIPCCVDLQEFEPSADRPRPPSTFGVDDPFVVAYLGSIGTWYLFDEMVEFFRSVVGRHAQARLLVVTPQDHHRLVQQILDRRPELKSKVALRSSRPSDVWRHLVSARVGLAFIKPAFSKQFSSPTKIAEYLASGIPVVVNSGVGDLDDFVRRHRVGVVLNDLTAESYQRGVEELLELLQDDTLAGRCRQVAREHLSVALGRARYWEVYQALMRNGAAS